MRFRIPTALKVAATGVYLGAMNVLLGAAAAYVG